MSLHTNTPQPLPSDAMARTVTGGPIRGSYQVYSSPAGWPQLRVPFRKVDLGEPAEGPLQL